MELQDAVELIDQAIPPGRESVKWADLGCGNGTYTKALSELLTGSSTIYAVDKNKYQIANRNGNSIEFIQADFQGTLPMQNLDGILMANSLHFVDEKFGFLKKLKQHLRPGGRIIIIEYDRELANEWVPFPITFIDLQRICSGIGFINMERVAERKSMFGPEMMYVCVMDIK